MRTSTRLLVGLAAAGAVAAGGSAFTASNNLAVDNVAGYGEASVTGADALSIRHTLSANGASIMSSVVEFTAVLKNNAVVRAGWDGAAQVTCTRNTGSNTTVTCSYGAGVPTSTATVFSVSVS